MAQNNYVPSGRLRPRPARGHGAQGWVLRDAQRCRRAVGTPVCRHGDVRHGLGEDHRRRGQSRDDQPRRGAARAVQRGQGQALRHGDLRRLPQARRRAARGARARVRLAGKTRGSSHDDVRVRAGRGRRPAAHAAAAGGAARDGDGAAAAPGRGPHGQHHGPAGRAERGAPRSREQERLEIVESAR